jgi:hypothetical protein
MNFDRFAGMASAVGIVLILMIVTWLGLWGPVSIDSIKEWQTLIGFGGTLAVGAIAWVNVSRQIQQQRTGTRLTLLSREEDRIEAELPGLKDAALFCEATSRQLKATDDIEQIAKRLREAKIAVQPSKVRAAVNELLPATDDRTRRLLIARLQILVTKCASALVIFSSGREGAPAGNPEVHLPMDDAARFETQMVEVREAINEVARFGAKLRSTVRWKIRQLSQIRAEIDAGTS